ncbi:MAG: hypothetical protein DRG30_01420 [Epsilonproteobacteria bacterium]|nr:MAG: hypothetical protein DRG30_01420 [Campylobacterota bacterium]
MKKEILITFTDTNLNIEPVNCTGEDFGVAIVHMIATLIQDSGKTEAEIFALLQAGYNHAKITK